ncbi:MAG: hypothetical protein SO253_04340 [Bacilli bacterium]|nr:hypothetical protein [Bacilli bacterium]
MAKEKNELYNKFVFDYIFPLLGMPKEIIKDYKENKIEDTQYSNFSNNASGDLRKKLSLELPLYVSNGDNEQVELHFGTINPKNYIFKICFKKDEIDTDMLNLIKKTLKIFTSVLNYNKSIETDTDSKTGISNLVYKENDQIEGKYLDILFEYSIQKGICEWVTNDDHKNKFKFERLVSILENWSKKTYEGHPVCFGILYDSNDNKSFTVDSYRNHFLDFLEDEYAATLSDGITSIIKVNKDCDFVNYESITENGKIYGCDYKKLLLPTRFCQIIEKNVKNQNIGIFLLQNGDIILAKKQQIYFIKRNGKWLNFQYSSFKNNIEFYLKNQTISDDIIREMYSTALDVSLAHAGGIIALVDYKKYKKDLNEIINPIDNLIDIEYDSTLYKKEAVKFIAELKMESLKNIKYLSEKIDLVSFEKENTNKKIEIIFKNFDNIDNLINVILKENEEFNTRVKDLKKRLTKRHYIKQLLTHSMLNKEFNILNIDKKLKTELCGLDGACIFDYSGNIVSFGAIIQNDSGSSGGGRGAAAKKLSKYGGLAIKISTDGYIETYIDYKMVYSIK